MTSFGNDLPLAWRSLRRSPWYATGVLLVLALGLGANAAMFAVLRGTLLRPLLFRHTEQLVALEAHAHDGSDVSLAPQDIDLWSRRTHTLSAIAYYTRDQVTLSGAGAQQEADSLRTSANLFSTLGTAPALGRTYTTAEQQPGRDHVAVLSDTLWHTQFHADPHVLGKTLRLNDDPYIVVGVMPRGFTFPASTDADAQLWSPASLLGADKTRDARDVNSLYSAVGRRLPGVTPTEVTTEIDALEAAIAALAPQHGNDPFAVAHIEAVDLRHTLDRNQRTAMLALTGAVGLLWLIACADVASLLLVRVTARRREFAIRSSLGASSWQVARILLAEVVLLTAAGSVAGLLLGQGLLMLFARRLEHLFGTGIPLHPDWAVVAALFGLSILSALLLSALPLWLGIRGSLESALRADGTHAGMGRHQGHLQRILVVTELAFTLCLLVGCGLLLRTVLALQHVPLGFRTDHVYSISPNLPFSRYKAQDPNLTVYQPLARRLRSLPGVDALAVTTVTPLAKRFEVNFMLSPEHSPGKKPLPQPILAKLRAAGPEFQKVLGFRMLQGRFFNAGDTATAQPVAVVNRAFAQEWAATGQELSHFTLGKGDRTIHVVGVIDDFHQEGISEPAAPEIDLNGLQQLPTDSFYQPTMKVHAEILLRSGRDPRSLLPELRHALIATSPDLDDADISSMQQVVDDAMGSQLLATRLLEVLGGLALLVALTGLYSLLAYLVALRRRELGVRLALGAQRADITGLVLRSASALLLTGALAGLALSLAVAHLLTRFLYGVGSYDLPTFLLATLALLLAGLAAAAGPAYRAAGVHPTEALRTE